MGGTRALARTGLERALAAVYLAGCDRIGRRVRAEGRPAITNLGRIEIGDDVTIRSTGGPVRLSAARSALIAIGAGTTIEFGATIAARSSIRIGAGVRVGPRA